MKKITLAILCSISIIACSNNKSETKKTITSKYSVEEFISGDKEVQHIWYENRMSEMGLKDEARDNYSIIVKYYSLKMKQLENNKLSDTELQREFPKLIRKLNKDVSKYLSEEQFQTHKESWKTILVAIYQRKGWELNLSQYNPF
ncbi:hypothetical protein [Winogradskyella haliclonae]|uniref:Lipoprotein n=1 Tax=Winogradskyella haliclonae TaxID=2048558 RepID=A0ABQ2BX12_9FLAO|nr:hypothetical protein [Winogradskyella haliclonae]GGI56985.1 hypothetical protein GCM10011444_12940 [Winogradskyella haliclonae]